MFFCCANQTRPRRIERSMKPLIVALLIAHVALVPSGAVAAEATCQGQAATIEASSGTVTGTSGDDVIVVTSTPTGEPPHEVVIVRSPSSLRRPSTGHVVIEHRSLTGHDDSIERPADEAVALFWRFMIEKFGVAPQ